jgi:hypothetical protein
MTKKLIETENQAFLSLNKFLYKVSKIDRDNNRVQINIDHPQILEDAIWVNFEFIENKEV